MSKPYAITLDVLVLAYMEEGCWWEHSVCIPIHYHYYTLAMAQWQAVEWVYPICLQ